MAAEAGLLVLEPGLCTTVQDLGRPGHRAFGVPEGGAFDRSSHRLANALVGNGAEAATVEWTMVGGRYRATRPLGLAAAGAPFVARLRSRSGERTLPIPGSFPMEVGDEIHMGGCPTGLRGYLAVVGGWRTGPVLGSRSSEQRLVAGTVLPAGSSTLIPRRPAPGDSPDPGAAPIRLIDGPDGPVPGPLLAGPFRVGGASDRAGIRLEGPILEGLEVPGKASSPVAPGALQVAGGRGLILGVAGGTMGGYPHVAHVISADLDRLAQARPGTELRFARVSTAEARRVDRERRHMLAIRDRRIALGAGTTGLD